MKKLIFLLCCFLCYSALFGQIESDYQKLKSTGRVPGYFLEMGSEKFINDANTINKKSKGKKVQKGFYLESNFETQSLLLSGKVLFNDVISNYLNEILEKIKKANPNLNLDKVRFHNHQSTIINAFATHSGLIFINTGLIAKFRTEDEIAFIMCHEIAHYLEKHSIKRYTHSDSLDYKRYKYENDNSEEIIFAKSNYSKGNEMEADSLGYQLFLNTSYQIESAAKALKLLKSYHLPFESNLIFSKRLINTFLDSSNKTPNPTLNSFTVYKPEIDSKFSTHPEIETRISAISADHSNTPQTGQLVLNKMQKIAQFELCHLFLEKGMFYHALFCAFTLQMEYKNNQYINETIIKSLYSICETRHTQLQDKSTFEIKKDIFETKKDSFEIKRNTFEIKRSKYEIKRDTFKFDLRGGQNVTNKYESAPKVIQQMKQFFENVFCGDLVQGTVLKIWKHHKKYGLNKSMKLRLNRLLEIYKNIYPYEDISKGATFNIIYNKEENITDLLAIKQEKDSSVTKMRVNKMIVLTPSYQKWNLNKKQSLKYLASEKMLSKYTKIIERNTSKLEVEANILSHSFLREDNVELYNDIATIKAFLIEKAMTVHNSIPSTKEDILKLVEKYGTSKLALLGVVSVQVKKATAAKVFALIWTAVAYPTFPLGLWYAFKPKYITLNYTLMVDLLTGRINYENTHQIKMNGKRGTITSPMYHDISKIKNGQYDL